jgi:hypothetical protein
METDEQKIHYALNLWANYIETGNVVLCAQDAQRQGERVKALDISQMKMVIRLRELAQMAATGKISVQNA